MSVRLRRLRALMKEQVSDIIQSRMSDPELGFVTVTDAELSPDLRHAKVFVSVYGSAEERAGSLRALQRATGFVRSQLGERLRLKFTPEIVFVYDPAVERAARVFELLADLHAGDAAAAGAEAPGEEEKDS